MPDEPALGLQRGKTIIQAYDPRWRTAFATESALLRSVLPETHAELEHVGSTAVSGLAAKPILDIAVGYSKEDKLATIQRALEGVGYTFHGDQGAEGGLVFIKGPETCRTHYLHLVALDSPQWQNYLAFRDALRANAALRASYETLKRRLAATYPDDRMSYLDGKASFIENALRELGASSR